MKSCLQPLLVALDPTTAGPPLMMPGFVPISRLVPLLAVRR